MKLTPAQARYLQELADGVAMRRFGAAARGGLVATRKALKRMGLIDDNGITDAGRKALAEYDKGGKP